MLNCAIIDDEPLAREGIGNYVKDISFLHLVESCQNAVDLIEVLGQHPIDLIFLDIQMPKINGVDFLKMFPNPPMVIVTTAFPDYALESFQLNVLDYLLKPIIFERFLMSVNKAKDYHHLIKKANTPNMQESEAVADYFFIKCGTKYEKLRFVDILYVEGMQNYVTIYSIKGKFVTLLNLRSLEKNLDNKSFIRVHKSFIIAIDKIDSIQGNVIFIDSHRIPISRNYREQVIQQVVTAKLWDKSTFNE